MKSFLLPKKKEKRCVPGNKPYIPAFQVCSRISNNGIVVILVLHVRDIILFEICCVCHIPRIVHGSHIPSLQGLGARQPSGPQPAVFVVTRRSTRTLEVLAIAHQGFLVASIAGEVIIQPAMTGNVSGDEKLLPGRQEGRSEAFGVGIGPRPGGKFVHQVVASGEELFWCYLAGFSEGGVVRDRGVPIS